MTTRNSSARSLTDLQQALLDAIWSKRAWSVALVVAATAGASLARQVLHAQASAGQTKGTALLAGQVVDTNGHGIAGAIVRLGRGRQMGDTVVLAAPLGGLRGAPPDTMPVSTDSQGRFFFGELAAGTYVALASKPGYLAATTGSRATTIADGEHFTTVRLRLVELGSLSGSVTDDAGSPVVRTDVVALRRALVNGRSILQEQGHGQTDDRGAFSLDALRPGEYLVCACTRDPIPLDGPLLTAFAANPAQLAGLAARVAKLGAGAVVFDTALPTTPPTFYPSSPDADDAEPVSVTSGAERSGVNILASTVRAARVSGTMTGAGSALNASEVQLVQAGQNAKDRDGTALTAIAPVLVQPDGRFDFVMVPPGKYVLVVKHVDIGAGVGSPSGEALEFLGPRGFAIQQPARRPDAVEPTPLYAAIPVIVANADVMGLSVPLRRGAILKGRVQFVGSAQPPVAQSGRNDLMQFLLESAGFDPTDAASDVVGHVSVDGSFETPPLAPGRYDFRIQNGLPTWPTVKSIVMNGSDVLDLAFDVAASDLSDVVVTFSDVPRATLSGTLSGGAPAPSDDLTLLIFPADHQYWTDPAASARRFRSAVIDAKGTFTVGPLPAGHYFASVVPDEQARDWQDTATLEALTKKAMTIDLSDGDTKAIQVKR